MRKKIRKITDLVLVVGFLGFVYFVPVMTVCVNVPTAVKDVKNIRAALESQGTSYKDLSYNELKEFSKQFGGIPKIEPYYKNDRYKNNFVNLNGLVARCLKMNSLNRVQKLNNGFLTYFSGAKNIEKTSQNLIGLNKFLADRGIPFFYILAPCKNSVYDVKFAPGYGDDSRQNLINMIDTLTSAGVEVVDMDRWFEENGWRTEDIFFRTDNHWIPEAGLASARHVMELLQEKKIAVYDAEKLREENYEKQILKNWYLGAWGKRAGYYFGGADDITLYHPKFETDYFYTGLRKNTKNWEYRRDILDMSRAEKKDYYENDSYSMYMYADYPTRFTVNTKARNNKKLLYMGDSFKLMEEPFFTTQFREVHTMHLGFFSDGTFAQHIEEYKPDIVMMCITEQSIADVKLHSFGVDEYLAALEKTDPSSPVQSLGNFELCAEENNNDKFVGVCGNLEANQAYTLTVDRTALSGVEHSFVQMTLQNLSTNKAIFNRYFESNCGARQKWIFTTPEKVEDAYGIFLYAGTKGHTAGIDVKVEGIRLRKGIFED